MSPVFADTSYYLALLHQDDASHEKALLFSQVEVLPVVLTDFVLIEVANTFSRGYARQVFLDLVRQLRSDPAAVIVPASNALFEAGLLAQGQRLVSDGLHVLCRHAPTPPHGRVDGRPPL